MEAHDLRTRHAGRVTFVEFHLVVPSDMRVGEVRVTIHVEPEEKAKHRGVLVLS